MKEKITNKILSQSNQFNYYKKLSEELKQKINKENEKYKKITEELKQKNEECNEYKNLISELNNKNEKYKKITEELKQKNNEIKWEINRKSLYNSFNELLARSYYNPIIESPFTKIDYECFSFMNIIASYLRINLNNINEPLISIIMPTYKRANIIKYAIDSVLKQSYKNFELIIIDDGSKDGTVELIESIIDKDNRIKLIKHEKNEGVCKSRNDGLKIAKGEYIFYLDSDNTWEKEYLKTMVGAYFELPDAKALYSGQFILKNYNSPIEKVRYGIFNKSLIYNSNYIDLNCFTHRKEIYDIIGGFNEKLKRLNDYDYILKIIDYNFKIYSIPVILSNYYTNNTNNKISDNIEYNLKDIYKLHDKYQLTIKDKHLKIKCTKNKKKYKLKKEINIVIFVDDELTNIQDCLESLLTDNNFKKFNIITLYSGNNIKIKKFLNLLQKEGLIKFFNENINYDNLIGINKIIDYFNNNANIIFLRGNAIITENVIEILEKYSNELKDYGVLVTREIKIKGKKELKRHVPYCTIKGNCDISISNELKNNINIPLFYNDKYLELNYAEFFCIYMKREVYNNSIKINPELKSFNSKNFYNYIRYILNKKIYLISETDVFYKDINYLHK